MGASTKPPAAPGIYAWWIQPDVLPDVPLTPHPTHDSLGLAYVGITAASLRTRIVANHLCGSTATSTLRKAVAAIVWRQHGWERRWTAGTDDTRPRVVLVPESNDELTELLQKTFSLTWAAHSNPGSIEQSMLPPLNSKYNRSHPFFDRLCALRSELSERP